MLFSDAVKVFEEIEKTTKRKLITDLLSNLFSKAGDDLKSLVYLIQGTLAPDYEGIESGMSDKYILKAIAEVSGKSVEEVTSMFHKIGDLGSLAENVLVSNANKIVEPVSLSIREMHEKLLEIAKSSGKGSTGERIRIYESVIVNSTPVEAKYATRILTGKLRLGASDMTILAALSTCFNYQDSEEVENAFNLHPDLGYIADLLKIGDNERIRNSSPELGVPIKVMLAERLPTIDSILEKMDGLATAFEFKYDGIRCQLHKRSGTIWIYSRGTENQTEQFPDIKKNALESFKDHDCILDGEAVPMNPETGEIYPFQAVSQRRGRKYNLDNAVLEVPLTVFLFDILYLDGKSLVNIPYPERRSILESIVNDTPGFRLAERIVSSDAKEIEKFFDLSIESGCEGVVAKNMSDKSIYRAGARGWLWIKMKRDYQSELADTLDLVVVGAFAGHGRRKGTYGALLMASYNKEKDTFETVCKLGTGFTDDVLFSLPKRFAGVVSTGKPSNVDSIMVPDVWINPVQVLEVSGAEITLSPVHTAAIGAVSNVAGLAVRFPRFTGRFRDDKTAFDSTSTQEIVNMYNTQVKKTKTSA